MWLGLRRLLWEYQSVLLGYVFLGLFLVFEWNHHMSTVFHSDVSFSSSFYAVLGICFILKVYVILSSVFKPFLIRSESDRAIALDILYFGWMVWVAQGVEFISSTTGLFFFFGLLCVVHVFFKSIIRKFFVDHFACHHWVDMSNALWCMNLGLLEPHRGLMILLGWIGA